MPWLVAGLGNPGHGYETNRHNVGSMVVDELAREEGGRFRKARFEGERVLLVKSLRFMNESGPSFASIARKQDIGPESVIAVHDDIDLAFGALRVKLGGSTAGHNGLKSLQQALRTPEFLRVRLGVGRPAGQKDPADFVLESFAKGEQADVSIFVDDAAKAVRCLVTEGISTAQDRFNRAGPRG